MSASYTYTRTRVTEEGFGGDRAFEDGEPLVRRPRHQASATAAVALTDALRARVDVVYTGRRADLDFTNPAEFQGLRTALPAWTTVDIGSEYRILRRGGTRLDFSVLLKNALDERYDAIYNFPAPARVLEVGARAAFGF
jgi:outer membrane cobalamin receptor